MQAPTGQVTSFIACDARLAWGKADEVYHLGILRSVSLSTISCTTEWSTAGRINLNLVYPHFAGKPCSINLCVIFMLI